MSLMTAEKVQAIIEAAMMIAGRPLPLIALQNLFEKDEQPTKDELKEALEAIEARHADSGIELKQVASGYRLQAKSNLSPWLAKLHEERPPRYSRAFLETLAIIAYKQPITRAEIEEIRGVTVSTNIMKTLQEREWVRLMGFKDAPGKPALYGTTKAFLDEFNLKKLTDLPTLAEFKDVKAHDADLQVQLAIENSNVGPNDSENIPAERDATVATEEGDTDTDAHTSQEAATEAGTEVEATVMHATDETEHNDEPDEAIDAVAMNEAEEITETAAETTTTEQMEATQEATDSELDDELEDNLALAQS